MGLGSIIGRGMVFPDGTVVRGAPGGTYDRGFPMTKNNLAPIAAMDKKPATISMQTMVNAHSSLSSLMVMYCMVPAFPEFHSENR